ncbi:MAG: hypothetical protein AAFX02_11135, partial [Pseudomonadota bacterium]
MRAPILLSNEQVRTSAVTQTVRADPNTFGAQLGQGISNVGRSLEDVGAVIEQRRLKLEAKKDRRHAQNAFLAASSEVRGLIAEYNQLEKTDAEERMLEYSDKVNLAFVRGREGLTSENSRDHYDGLSLSSLNNSLNGIASHGARQGMLADAESDALLLQQKIDETVAEIDNLPSLLEKLGELEGLVYLQSDASHEAVQDEAAQSILNQALARGIIAAYEDGRVDIAAERMRDFEDIDFTPEQEDLINTARITATLENTKLSVLEYAAAEGDPLWRQQERAEEYIPKIATDPAEIERLKFEINEHFQKEHALDSQRQAHFAYKTQDLLDDKVPWDRWPTEVKNFYSDEDRE